jgi:hypothetical protein
MGVIDMALRGGDPKGSNKHGRTPVADWVEVDDVPYAGPWPELPKLPGRAKWNELAMRWWDTIRVMPHCALWDDADWLYAVETAVMKHYYFRAVANDEATTSAATEIRRREDNIGTTMEARRKLRIRYVEPEHAGVQDQVGQGVEDDRPAKVIEQTGPGAGSGGQVLPLAERRRRLTQQGKTA